MTIWPFFGGGGTIYGRNLASPNKQLLLICRPLFGWITSSGRAPQGPACNHPLVFLFMGSSGIGKTELAKQTAEYMHSEQAGTWSGQQASLRSENRL